MRFRSTGLLLVIFAALLAYVYFFEIKGKEKAEARKEQESKLLAFEKDSLKALELKPEGIRFKKEKDQWLIVEPVRSKTETWQVNGLINSIADAKKERVVASGRNAFADFGLAPARHELILHYNGRTDTVWVGEKSPTGSYVFAAVSGDSQVYATHTLLLTNADKELFDFRDKTILSFETNNVERLKIENPKATIEARKEGDDWYILDGERKILADDGKISQILSTVRNAKAKKFVEETPANLNKYGLTKPGYRLELSVSGDGGLHTLIVGNRENGTYYARDVSRDPVFTVDSSTVHKLDVSLWDLREKKLADFYSYQVDYLELQLPDTTFVCEKDSAGDWHVLQPVKGKAKNWKISSITSSASTLRAQKIVEEEPKLLKKYGLDEPQIQIICKKAGEEVANIKIGGKVGDQYYAQGSTSPAVVLIDADDVNSFKVTLEDLLEKDAEKEQKEE